MNDKEKDYGSKLERIERQCLLTQKYKKTGKREK